MPTLDLTRSGKRKFKPLAMAAALLLLSTIPAGAKDEFIMDTSSIGRSTNGVVSSDQFLELGVPTSNALRIEGEQSLRIGNLDRAIMVLQRSVEMSPLDMDGRILYAEALEKKLKRQKEKDPVLYNFIVKQWLYVAKKAEFVDQQMIGSSHLMALTGKRPGRFEREKTFLAKVLLPEDQPMVAHSGKKKEKTE
ncbi:MAG TPA: hypothetical protein V6D17_23510 [Candidatus Obscuribacterales bacterium]